MMVFGVMLGGVIAKIERAGGMTVSGVSVVGGLLVVAGLVVLGRLVMMLGGVLVMLGGRLMMVGAFVRRFRHGVCSLFWGARLPGDARSPRSVDFEVREIRSGLLGLRRFGRADGHFTSGLARRERPKLLNVNNSPRRWRPLATAR